MATAASNSIQIGSMTVDVLVDADDSNGSVTAFECTVPAGLKVPARTPDVDAFARRGQRSCKRVSQMAESGFCVSEAGFAWLV